MQIQPQYLAGVRGTLKVKAANKTFDVTREQRDGDALERDCQAIMAAKAVLLSGPLVLLPGHPTVLVQQWEAVTA